MEQDMVPKDVMEKYEKGEDINYNTAYGKGYITKEGHEKMKKYEININEPIEVNKTFEKYVLPVIYRFSKKNENANSNSHTKKLKN